MRDDEWYLDEDRYWVSAADAGAYPLRQGDLIAGFDDDRLNWPMAQIVHPTCELAKPSVKRIQIARVRPLSDLPNDFLRQLVMTGFREVGGSRRAAIVHTFFLAPWSANGEPCFVDFREMDSIDRAAASEDSRIATMTHDCRVAWVRRWIHFRLRLPISYQYVQQMEADRIAADALFRGPRPKWAERAG